MKCPYNDVELVKEIWEADVEVDRCPRCRGIWLDPGELERIQETQEIDYSQELQAPLNEEALAYNHERQLQEEAIACPKCGARMTKEEHGFNQWIVIDICPGCHGIWLDDGELELLEIYYEREHARHPEMTRIQLILAGFYKYFARLRS